MKARAEAADLAGFREKVRQEALAQGLDPELADLVAEHVGRAEPTQQSHDEARAARAAFYVDARQLSAVCRAAHLRGFERDFWAAGMDFKAASKLLSDDLQSLGSEAGRGVRVMARLHYLRNNKQ